MIELPEASVISKQINSNLIGKKISNVVANHTPHRFANYTGNPEEYSKMLVGKTLLQSSAMSNHIYLTMDDMTLIINTPIIYHTNIEALPKKHQLLIEFADRSAITCTIQMWGVFYCYKTCEKDNYDYHIEKDKPSPLWEQFNEEYFYGLLNESKKTLSVKGFLATEQRIPGLGNGVLQDILWNAKINPRSKLKDLSEESIDRLFKAIKSVLKNMETKGGRDSERDLFGDFGKYKTILNKKTVGTECPSCNDIIQKESYLGGSVYYCPTCQKL